jgi:hypothetical protein
LPRVREGGSFCQSSGNNRHDLSYTKMSRTTLPRIIGRAVIGLAALLATGVLDPASARRRGAERVETVATRPAGEPVMAIVSLGSQRVTIYDSEGWILRAPVSSGQPGYETPPGIYSVLQKEADHYSNLYDDASMPFMQRITWSGIALHAGELPGHPASHGCVRMPYDFAEHLFEMTKLGMRVIISRHDVRPTEIDHPALFAPAPPLPDLKALTSAKATEAQAAARKANAARLTAARLTGEAARLVPAAEGMKLRAEAQLAAAEAARSAAISPPAIRFSEEAQARARARLDEAEAQLRAAREQAPLKAEAAARAREEVSAAEAEKLAASEASREAARKMTPASIFISRKTGHLYVRQAFQQILESPVTIRDAGEPIGTHIYTALTATSGGTGLRWNVVSLRSGSEASATRRGDDEPYGSVVLETNPARAALERIEIPQDVAARIAEIITPGSSLIVSDEGPSVETGKDTDFVVLMSGEPQGGIKKRRPAAQARNNRDDTYYDRPPRRSSRSQTPYYWADPYSPW